MTLWTMPFWGSKRRDRATSPGGAGRRPRRRRPGCEGLEGRTLMTVAPATGGVNVDYTLMGGQWDDSRPITFSVAPDGVSWDQGVNAINAQLDGEFGGASWQRTIATALQTWAASANLNFVSTTDGPYAFNASGSGQGDPRFGDIRVGGYAFQGDNTIALTYGPPPNGNTAGGDVKLNLGYNFGPTGQWDLQTTLLHELGHSLGLGESPQPDSVMYAYYSGTRHDLSSYDVEGIQSLYGPRQADSYQGRGMATSPTSAADVTAALGGGLSGQVGALSLDAIGDSEYFAVTAPATASGMLMVNAIANGHSLMSPKVTVTDPATGQVLATDAHPDQYGDTASVAVPGVQPGHRYLITVAGATSDVFSVGDYVLQVAFNGSTGGGGTTSPPASPVTITPTTTPTSPATTVPVTYPTTPTGTITLPTAPTPVATTPATTTTTTAVNLASDPYAANTTLTAPAELGPVARPMLTSGVTLPSGQAVRVFAFETTAAGLVQVASANAKVTILNANGQVVASGRGLIGFSAPQAGSRYLIVVASANGAAVANANFAVLEAAADSPTSTVAISGVGGSTGKAKAKAGHPAPAKPKAHRKPVRRGHK